MGYQPNDKWLLLICAELQSTAGTDGDDGYCCTSGKVVDCPAARAVLPLPTPRTGRLEVRYLHGPDGAVSALLLRDTRKRTTRVDVPVHFIKNADWKLIGGSPSARSAGRTGRCMWRCLWGAVSAAVTGTVEQPLCSGCGPRIRDQGSADSSNSLRTFDQSFSRLIETNP